MGQEDKFPLWPGSVELAQTLMGQLGKHGVQSKLRACFALVSSYIRPT